jgi:hypothetical protein
MLVMSNAFLRANITIFFVKGSFLRLTWGFSQGCCPTDFLIRLLRNAKTYGMNAWINT